jgi:hypothetical protein
MIPPEVKAERARQRLLEKAKEYTTGTYSRKFVAPLFQRMIRAEFGADTRTFFPAVVDGKVKQVKRCMGECVCVTCGKLDRWDGGIGGMHTGHFIGSRCNSILFEETNVATQCPHCNVYRHGAPQEFRLWMEVMHGKAEIERLERLRNKSKSFSREELVDMRIDYQKRLDAAIEKMG